MQKPPENRETFVGLLGLEPRLFCTKNRRVASYTIDQNDCKSNYSDET